MSSEVEIKLTLPRHGLRKLQAVPWVHSLAKQAVTRTLISTYYDTADFALQKKGITLRIRHLGERRIQAIKAIDSGMPFARHEWEQDISGDRPVYKTIKGVPAHKLLKGIFPHELKPVFKTRVRRTTMLVRTAADEVELSIDHGTVEAKAGSCRIDEIELELKKGEIAAIGRVLKPLCRALPLSYQVKAKSERGYALAQGQAAEAARAEVIVLKGDMDVAAAFQIVGHSCLRHLARNVDVVRLRDGEGVHQMRVALRRLRAAMVIFKDIVQSRETEQLGAELVWLGRQLAPARDYDVLMKQYIGPLNGSYSKDKEFVTLSRGLQEKRRAAFAKAAKIVSGARYRRIVVHIVQWLMSDWRRGNKSGRHSRPEQSVASFAKDALVKRAQKITRKIRKIERLDARHRHKLRVAIKELRYGLEFFGSLYGHKKKPYKAFVGALEALQDTLGMLNDIQVQSTLIKDELSRQSGRGSSKTASKAVARAGKERRKDIGPLIEKTMKDGKHLKKLACALD